MTRPNPAGVFQGGRCPLGMTGESPAMAGLGAVVVALALTCSIALAGKKEDQAAAAFFVADRVHEIHVTVSPQQWQTMQPTRTRLNRPYAIASQMPAPSTLPSTRPVLSTRPTKENKPREEGERLEPNFYGMQFAYVKARFECDGQVMTDVGFRERGNSSYNWARDNNRRPFKVSFKHFVDDQKFQGINEFYLNNNAYDPTYLRETLAYEVFRKLGVPTPRTTLARVYLTITGKVDRQYLGLYTLIEDVDSKAFLKTHFRSAEGLLLKPWLMRGFPYMGEQWEAYELHYTPRTDPTPQTARRTIDFLKLINYADDATFTNQIESYLNVEAFLRWLAGHVILSNLDNPLYTGHNFYMYLNPADNKFYLVPWDMNLAFANFTSVGSADQLVHLSMMRPHAGETKIIDRLLANPKYAQQYRDIIAKFIAKEFAPAAMFPRIEQLETILTGAEAAADADWAARFKNPVTKPATVPSTAPSTKPNEIPPRPSLQMTGWRGMPAIAIREFITRRIEAISTQLAGQTDGFVPIRREPPAPPPGGLRAPAVFSELPTLAVFVMRGADANFDWKITRDEWLAGVEVFFNQADAAKAGSLDKMRLSVALMNAISVRQSQSPRRGDRRTPQPRLAESAPNWAGVIVVAADAQATGRVTLAQLLTAAGRAFDQADKDKSGKLDDVELLGLMDQLAAPPVLPQTLPSTRAATQPATRP